MTHLILWTLLVAVTSGSLGFLACALLMSGKQGSETQTRLLASALTRTAPSAPKGASSR